MAIEAGVYRIASRECREASMGGEMILLRVVDDAREGWNCMPFDEFLERVNLNSWKDGQELVGVVLPQTQQRRSTDGSEPVSH
jgi:hypothetical protein